jgi:hypothetical protein
MSLARHRRSRLRPSHALDASPLLELSRARLTVLARHRAPLSRLPGAPPPRALRTLPECPERPDRGRALSLSRPRTRGGAPHQSRRRPTRPGSHRRGFGDVAARGPAAAILRPAHAVPVQPVGEMAWPPRHPRLRRRQAGGRAPVATRPGTTLAVLALAQTRASSSSRLTANEILTPIDQNCEPMASQTHQIRPL